MLYPDSWRDYGLRNGFRQEYNISLSGGSNRGTFYGSIGYLDNEGITYGSRLKRFSSKIKADFDAYSWLKVGANAGYTHTVSDAQTAAFSVCHNIAPVFPLFIRDGLGNILQDANGPRYDYGDGTNGGMTRAVEQNYNSIQSDLLDINQMNNNAFNFQGYANINLPWDIKITVNGSAYILEGRWKVTTNPYYGYNTQSEGSAYTEHFREFDVNYQQLINWNRSFGKHTIDILAGHEYNSTKYYDVQGTRFKFANYKTNTEIDGAIINSSAYGYQNDYNVEGWFGRAQWDYDSRYFASASFRADGSSRFHPKHRWGKFWSVGGAWIMTKEEWFPKTPAVNMLKYKISYGSQGNDNISDYLYTDYYTIENANDEVAIVFNRKGNPEITWETVGNLNTGFEFDLLNNKLGGSIEYYHRKTTDMLTTKSVPTSMGYTYYWDNVGDMTNQGLELNLYATPIRTKNINWTLNGNLSWNRNRIDKLSDDNRRMQLDGHNGYSSNYYFYGEGLPLYTWYMPKYAGPGADGCSTWYTTEAKADVDAAGNPVKDASGNYITSYSSLAELYDCGTALPDVYGGFGTTLTAYGFDLSLQFNYSIGGKKLDAGYQSLMACPTESTTGYNYHRDLLDAWSESNTGSSIPRWQYGDETANSTSDRFLIDASYLAFKSINFGYTLPQKWSGAIKASSIRVYFTVDNVAYWTKRKGFDPRVATITGDDAGVTSGSVYSPMRTFMGGINVVF